jgi:hypothetical protein
MTFVQVAEMKPALSKTKGAQKPCPHATGYMGLTHSRTPSLWQAMIEDPAEEFLTASSGEGGFSLPSPRRHSTGIRPAPIATTPWTENAPAT